MCKVGDAWYKKGGCGHTLPIKSSQVFFSKTLVELKK